MLIIDIKETELTYNGQLIHKQIYNERIKAEYIPAYISENGVRVVIKLKLPKLNEFPDIYDIQIFTMICIHYRSLNVERGWKASANKNVLACIY